MKSKLKKNIPHQISFLIFLVFTPSIASGDPNISSYGRINAGLSLTKSNQINSYAKKSPTYIGIKNPNWCNYQWGIKVSETLPKESLGTATVILESNVLPDEKENISKVSKKIWGQTYFQFANKKLGVLKIGRQYNNPYNSLIQSPQEKKKQKNRRDLSNINYLNSEILFNRSVKYETPEIKGLSSTGFYSLKLGEKGKKYQQIWSGAISYSKTPMKFGLSYSNIGKEIEDCQNKIYRMKDPLNFCHEKKFNGSKKNIPSLRIITLDSIYQMNELIFSASVSKTIARKIEKDNILPIKRNINPFHTRHSSNFETNLSYQATSLLSLGTTYIYTAKKRKHINQFEIHAIYNVTKTTSFYVAASYQKKNGPRKKKEILYASLINSRSGDSIYRTCLTTGLRYEF